MAALVDQVKGKRVQELTDEQIELRQAAAAHYLGTDHDTAAGRLIQGQVDHTLLVGHRVKSSDEELKKLAGEFGQSDGDVVRHLGTCPVCQRSVTHGEFGVDHIMYYLEGDEEKAPRKAKQHAKRNKKPYLRSRAEETLAEAWGNFVKKVREDQGQTIDGDAKEAEPANGPTRKLWAWLSQVLVSEHVVEVAKMTFRVSAVKPRRGSDLDLANKALKAEVDVIYEAEASLVSGEKVLARGSSLVTLALEPGAAAAVVSLTSSTAAKLRGEPPDAEVLERCLAKTDLVAKVWAKKAAPKLVLSRLADLRAKALKLMG